jgi:hypothetical protein
MALDNRVQNLLSELSAFRRQQRDLREGGPGGTSGDVTDDWKASVDRQLEQLHGDVRHLLYGLITGFLFLLGAGGFAYSKLSDQVNDGRVQTQRIEGKIDTLGAKLDAAAERKTDPAR